MDRTPPTIDMTPDGAFRAPPRRPVMPLSMKVALGAALVAMVGVTMTVAALAIWVVSLILPVVIIAGGVAWAAMRYRRWQLLRGGSDLRPQQPGRFGQ